MSENPKIKLNALAAEPIINKLLRRSPSPTPSPVQPHKQLQQSQSQQFFTGSATGNPRNKCALKPGHSLMDWIRLGSSGCDLAGTQGVITPVSHAELAKHCKSNDRWLAIRGKVYNVTRYTDFHPGGPDELSKGIGKDATKLFDEVHPWVNYEQLLAKCYVGPLVNTANISIGPEKPEKSSKLSPKSTSNGIFRTPILPFLQPINASQTGNTSGIQDTTAIIPQTPTEIIPRFDWIQKTTDLTIIFYTKSLCNPGFSIEFTSETNVEIRIFIEKTMHVFNFKFANEVEWPCTTKVFNETGKIEIIFHKTMPGLWTNFGLLDRRKTTDILEVNYQYDVINRVQLTHDSYATILQPTENVIQHFPIGSHINITVKIQGSDVTRSYTPVPVSYVPTSCEGLCVPLLVKSYSAGLLSKHITCECPLATSLRISTPQGNFSLVSIKSHTRIAIIAAGSGITPMLSILDYLVDRISNRIESIVIMLFNKTEADIWCRDRLATIAEKDERLKLEYILSEPHKLWSGQSGRISIDYATLLADSASSIYSTYCCICGPTQFNELSLKLLEDVGFSNQNIHIFRG